MSLELFNNLINNVKESNIVQNFMKELTNHLENTKNINQYDNYWKYQNFMEDNVAASIGISRWSANNRYKNELSEAVDNSLLKLSETEGTIYRKKFMPNGPSDNPIYNVDKFENGNIEHITLSGDKVPVGFKNEDIIFQYKTDGKPTVRMDLKERAVQLASENVKHLKTQENEKALDYKREGHIYEAIEDDGYIFLKDLTEKRDYVLEDIDFVVNCYEGDGKYKVIEGEYTKIQE